MILMLDFICRFNVLEEEKTSLRIRVLCAFILNHVPISNYPIFKEKYIVFSISFRFIVCC